MKTKNVLVVIGALALVAGAAHFDLSFLKASPALADKGGNGGGNSGGSKGSSSQGNANKSNAGTKGSASVKAVSSGSASQTQKKAASAASTAKAKKAAQAAAAKKSAKVQFAKNVNAQLKALNSLNRNIDGLMNSASPKFAAIRAFVQNYADYELAKIALQSAETTHASAKSSYDQLATDLTLNGTPEENAATLQSKLDTLNASPLLEGAEGYEQWSADVAATTAALATVTSYQQAVTGLADAQLALTEATAGTSEADLAAALALAANPNSQPELAAGTITPEALARAKQLVGFAEENGLIDAYVAQLTAPTTTTEP